MAKSRFPKSIRQFIRMGKAKIRREIFDSNKQDELIENLYKRFIKIKAEKSENK